MKKDVYPDVRIEIISEGLTKKILGKTNGATPVVYGEEQPEGKNLPNVEIKGKNKELQALLETSNKKPNYTGLVKEALLELRKDNHTSTPPPPPPQFASYKGKGQDPLVTSQTVGDVSDVDEALPEPDQAAIATARAGQQNLRSEAEIQAQAEEAKKLEQQQEIQSRIDSGEVLSSGKYDPVTGVATYGDSRTGELQSYKPFSEIESERRLLPTGERAEIRQPDVDMPPTGIDPGVTYTLDGKTYNELGFEVGKPLTFENMDPNSPLLRNFQGNQAMVQDFLSTGGADNKPPSAKEIREMLGIENAVQGLVKAAMFELRKQAPMMGGAAGQLPKTTSMTRPPNMGVNQQQPVIQGAGNMQLAREQKEPAERAEKPQVRPRTKLRPTALKTPTQDK